MRVRARVVATGFLPQQGWKRGAVPPCRPFLPSPGCPRCRQREAVGLAAGAARLIPGSLLSCGGGGWRLARLIHRAGFVMLGLAGSPSPRVLRLHSAVWRLVFQISSSLPDRKVLYSFDFEMIKGCLLC